MLTGVDATPRREAQEEPLRVLIERYAALLPILSEFDVDTCCGGGRRLAEMADVHGFDAQELLNLVVAHMRDTVERR